MTAVDEVELVEFKEGHSTLYSSEAINTLEEVDDDDNKDSTAADQVTVKDRCLSFLKAAGPGLVVMLADTDASCIITAADSGKQWGYSLILVQILLIPPLYMAQELTVRIGIVRKQGLGVLVKKDFGLWWGWFAVGTLLLTCVGGLVSEMTSIAGAGEIFGIPKWASAGTVGLIMTVVVFTGSYRRVEIIALVMGLAELTFAVTMIMAKPSGSEFVTGLATLPVKYNSYLLLFSANIGAVIMPWMIFYQCSAIIDKGLKRSQIENTKLDTAIGSVVTQFIMISVIITTAATAWNKQYNDSSPPFQNVAEIADSLSLVIGEQAGKILFMIGLTGGAFIGALVVSLTGAWALGEILGIERSLERSPRQAPWFYLAYLALMLLGLLIAISGVNIVLLNVIVQTSNTILLPIVLVFLFLISKRLPSKYALSGARMYCYGLLFVIVAGIGLVTGLMGIIDVIQNGVQPPPALRTPLNVTTST